MTTTQSAQTTLIEYLVLNPATAEKLIDACNSITACDPNGRPLRASINPDDFSNSEWAALVAVANLSE